MTVKQLVSSLRAEFSNFEKNETKAAVAAPVPKKVQAVAPKPVAEAPKPVIKKAQPPVKAPEPPKSVVLKAPAAAPKAAAPPKPAPQAPAPKAVAPAPAAPKQVKAVTLKKEEAPKPQQKPI